VRATAESPAHSGALRRGAPRLLSAVQPTEPAVAETIASVVRQYAAASADLDLPAVQAQGLH